MHSKRKIEGYLRHFGSVSAMSKATGKSERTIRDWRSLTHPMDKTAIILCDLLKKLDGKA